VVKVIVTVPALTPVTIPVADPIVAMAILSLIHTPPPVVTLSAVEAPTHTPVLPLITGIEFTVIVLVVIQLPIE
jgi:hypothetical protein